MNVPFAAPECGDEEIEEVAAVIKSGWLTTASRCARFENDFARFVDVKHALAVNSATAALHLGLEALGISEGDKVLVPTFTFTATAEVVRYLRADPVFVDCDRETFCINATYISKALKVQGSRFKVEDVRAIIPVHFGGHPCEMDDIKRETENLKLKILEDAAHALPAYYEGRKLGSGERIAAGKAPAKKMIGSIGDVTCFSFYANKTMTTGEGGMLCTDDDEIAKRVKVMRLHGINRDVWDRFSTGASWEYDVVAPGFKYNMADINAALGIHQLKKVELFREKRQRIAKRYYDGLKDIPGLIIPRLKCAMEDHSWYLFMVLIEPEETKNGMSRNRFIEALTKCNIGTSVHYKPLHRMTYYKERYGLKSEMFPHAEWVFERCVSLPIFSAMTDEQINYVIESIRKIML
ncbi:DegT/DnrJ/EryC1/StrS family aminotransferase [Thermodesulfovibrionales bacterium]|nr:DegT/DnrJ/EryC1/StrS family aminotransferase [Thermodesulfovibrionales bacterium]